MIELVTLGVVDLRDRDGREVRAVLAQPKRLALLVYLAVAQPCGFHRRDTLLGLFWPELDEGRARAALRKAVLVLRRGLGAGALVGRGDEELGLGGGAVACDAVAFQQAGGARRSSSAGWSGSGRGSGSWRRARCGRSRRRRPRRGATSTSCGGRAARSTSRPRTRA